MFSFKKSIQTKVNTVQLNPSDDAIKNLTWRLTVHDTKIIQIVETTGRKTVSLNEFIEQIKAHNKESYNIKIECTDLIDGQLRMMYYKICKK